jgi:peptidoglycan hydrolase-like protein with peptidoglycan-binding domain
MTFGGDMSLLAKIISSHESFIVEGQTFVKKFVFNDESLGDLFLDATILEDNNLYFFGGITQNNEHSNINFFKNKYSDYLSLPNKTVGLSGKMISKNKELRINAKIDSLKIGFLSPFLSSFSKIISGSASGELDFILIPDSLYFDGKVTVSNTQLEIIPLNTVYGITNQEILFDRKGIKFNQVEIKDKFKNKATLSGFVNHNKFKDFKIDMNISTPKILALNTPKKIDTPFYGDGFVSGDISIQGDTKQLNFTSHNIKTLPGSIITFPLSSANTVSSSKGIYFTESSEKKRFNASETLEKPSTTMNFDFAFDITKDADVKLEIDPIDGVLKCKTSGRLHLTYNSTFNDINLDGTLSIVSGKFNMSLKNFFPRDFTIIEGGNIAFSGPITSAQLNVSALYQKAASLGALSHTLNTIGRTDVMAYIGLTGNLMNPTPTFTFAFPRLTTENQMEVFAALDTANQQNGVRQFFSFVFLNTFIPVEQNTNSPKSPVGIGTGIDFVSGILSSFISNQSDNFSIGVNYVDNQDNYKEYSVNAAVNFYNNRLIFKTNLGYAENANNSNQNNSFVGDVNMEYRITDNWRFRAFYFNDKTGNNDFKPQQGGGVGISFQQEFNNRKDFSESRPQKKKDKKNKKIVP